MKIMKRHTLAASRIMGTIMIALFASSSIGHAQTTGTRGSLELIPSLGLTKSTDPNASAAKLFGGLALRMSLVPILKVEGGIGYRQDSYFDNTLKVRQWPVTASLWLSPIHSLYLGGGVGWYYTTLSYSTVPPIKSTTTNKAGVHIGGGLDVPIAPRLSLDVNGRYIFMTKDKASFDVPTTFNPDFWSVSAGLGIAL